MKLTPKMKVVVFYLLNDCWYSRVFDRAVKALHFIEDNGADWDYFYLKGV